MVRQEGKEGLKGEGREEREKRRMIFPSFGSQFLYLLDIGLWTNCLMCMSLQLLLTH